MQIDSTRPARSVPSQQLLLLLLYYRRPTRQKSLPCQCLTTRQQHLQQHLLQLGVMLLPVQVLLLLLLLNRLAWSPCTSQLHSSSCR